MPEATFYVLPSQSQQERQAFACKLIEKVYRSGHSCFVLTDSERQSRQVDDLLWTFRPGSFVPHQVYRDEEPAFPQTILIGHDGIPERWRKVVVNLSSTTPTQLDQCERILEILDNSEETKQAGRNRYRHYRQEGLDITTHNMQKG
ncbi:DNA polymerase III subunit chi [Methylomarinum vadi]|uniref:DNA polymerase III subunit chi n=1 Tax=Methylomarinum vadi TaxID=438855 RepID=UPI0004DFB766|nr:DNA polymerase III subunit chi [Methylomarinum vadi]